jgi:hypothetical protein
LAHPNTAFSQILKLVTRHRYRFKNKLYSPDTSTIDLCLSVLPCAKFRTSKGAAKLHDCMGHEGYFMSKPGPGIQHILSLLQPNLFKHHALNARLQGDPPEPRISPLQTHLQLV